jgi:mono/diheme cytochrome c family protein
MEASMPDRPDTVRLRYIEWSAPLVAIIIIAGGALVWAQRAHLPDRGAIIPAEERAHAVSVMRANGCAGCHTISGVPGAHGKAGPKLDASLSSRRYIGGVLPNNRENMIRWLRSSREISPHTAMPSSGISEDEARDVADYLYSLR